MDNSTETLVRVRNWLQGLLQCVYRRQGEVLEIPADSAYYYLDLITKALQVKPEELPNERQDYTLKDDTVNNSLARIEDSLAKLSAIVAERGSKVLVQ